MGAVTADVVEPAQLAVLAAHDEDRLVGDPLRHVGARLLELREVSDVVPVAVEDRLLLPLEHFRVEIEARGKGVGVCRVRVKCVIEIIAQEIEGHRFKLRSGTFVYRVSGAPALERVHDRAAVHRTEQPVAVVDHRHRRVGGGGVGD